MKALAALPPLAILAAAIAAGPAAAQPPLRGRAAAVRALAGPVTARDESDPVAVRPNAHADVLNINGAGERELHNRFLTAGLLAYASVIVGVILMLGRRRWAGAILMVAGLAISLALYLGIFG